MNRGLVVAAVLGVACGTCDVRSAPREPTAPLKAGGLAFGAPDEQRLDARPLVKLAEWVRDGSPAIFSILISKNGVVVFELYTSSLTRDHAHYLMSVTKSFTSALVGAAIDRGVVGSPKTSVADALPKRVFASEAERTRFRGVTIRDVLAMSALDAQVPPHRNLAEDQVRANEFWASTNRAEFALTQAVLPHPGVSFQYTDITPLIATGIIEYATHTTALEFAEQALFGPMEFRNYEWMHEDDVGIDNGAYGLRLRPIDMQKFGVLFLRGGAWEGKQLLSRDWVARSFSPWIKSSAALPVPNYGWYWWTYHYAPHWVARVAVGWKGQRIAVIPQQQMVVTMTGILGDDEDAVFERIIRDYVMPSADGRPDAALRPSLDKLLEQVRRGPLRVKPGVESRMIPSIEAKEIHHGFSP